VLRDHGDSSLEAFMTQQFSPTEWYDIAPSVHFAPIIAKARGAPVTQHMRDSALLHAERAAGGFTSVLLKLVSNETVGTWLPRMSAWYHDFGGIETRVVDDGLVRGTRTGLPIFVVQGWAILSMHFTEHVLALAGARDPRAHALDAEPDGEREGCPLYRVSFELSWSK
jgi:hypothetical protein